jgi:VanZ family protein
MRQRAVLFFATCLWLIGWGYFGFPRRHLTTTPMFQRVEWLPELHKPLDMLFNLGYYVLFGVLAAKLGARPRVAVGLALSLSAITELSQLFSPSRHPSATDLVVNTAGAMVGVLLIGRDSES